MLRRFVSLLAGAALVAGLGLAGGTPAQAAEKPVPVPGSTQAAKPLPAVGAPTEAVKGKGVLKGLPGKGGIASVNPPTCGSPPCFFYASKYQDSMTADGASITLNIPNPAYKSTDAHSLIELAVQDATGAQVVEVGVTRDTAVNGGSSAPHLFVGSWTNSTFNGYNGGGFVPVGGCSPCAGSNLTAAIGTNVNFAVQYINDGAGGVTDGWWIAYGANWIGVYPNSVWTSPTYTQSAWVQVFTEVASNNTSKSCSDGGNGKLASDGTAWAGSSFALVNGSVAAGWTGGFETDNTKWSSTAPTGTSLRAGGPGWNSIGTATGVAGSCAPATAGTAPASTMQFWQEICPDGSATGCTAGVAYNTGSAPLNTCVAVTAGSIINAYKNNSGVSGRSYNIYKTSGCTGSTILIGNGGSGSLAGTGFEDTATHGVVRRG